MVDEQGEPYIGYYDSGQGLLKIAYRQGTKWAIEIVDSGAGFTSSLQLHDGVLWISYADEAGMGLKVARREIAPRNASSSPKEAARSENSAGVKR